MDAYVAEAGVALATIGAADDKGLLWEEPKGLETLANAVLALT